MEQDPYSSKIDTSKHGLDISVHGKNGSFLASVASLSLLSIISHHRDYTSHSSLSLHYSRPVIRLIPAPDHQKLSNKAHGTKVVVRNLFGNMPVRVKQRVAEFSDGAKQGEKEVERLRKQVTALLIAWPRKITLTLTIGGGKKQRLMIHNRTQARMSETSLFHDARNDTFPREGDTGRLDLGWIMSVLTQAGYVDFEDRKTWLKTTARTSAVSVKGIISTKPAPTRQVQIFSLGVRPIGDVPNGSVLHDEINDLFAKSNFGNAELYDDLKDVKHANDRRFKQDGFTNKELKGGSKGIDRWPMFFIRIDLTHENDPCKLERENVLASILKVIKAMVERFLQDNNFRPRIRSRRTGRLPTRRPSAQQHPITVPNPFSDWSRVKTSRSYQGTAPSPKAKIDTDSARDESLVTQPFTPILVEQDSTMQREDTPDIVQDKDPIVEWKDPITKATVFINGRTGMACKRSSTLERPHTAPPALRSSPLSRTRLSLRPSTALNTPRAGSWASDFLANWMNPVFANTETPIPQVPNETNAEPADLLRKCHDHQLVTSAAFGQPNNIASLRLHKGALANPHVISQVDQKYILAKLPTSNGSHTLVLVDQHAADERVRVEALIEELYTRPPTTITKLLSFELTTREGHLLEEKQAYLSGFGIQYSISSNAGAKGSATAAIRCTINVTSLPEVIAERCRLQPPILLNLLRSIAWSDASTSAVPARPNLDVDSDKAATSVRPLPPKELLDLINSRACRSAIMFNDILTREESSELMAKLSKTKMPFQCAHGRNSMVPLLDLGQQAASVESEGEEGEESFVEAWKRWRRKEDGRDDEETEGG